MRTVLTLLREMNEDEVSIHQKFGIIASALKLFLAVIERVNKGQPVSIKIF